ncbi:MAG: tRNA (N6-isopentenyl adenosine(37)-C2)-methylthiotransferase MiaB [Desulfobacterales bacterium]|jgi:tRNA-2-methylthio-N6-dimethylallyladenosine synthase|nr:tRNA (N6-isopentenyl adenosine(37)-C2)-methylthiotransferase MiaB [Desulfobacterales bacterium]
MKKKYLYIQTIGCQMNVYDSDQMAQSLGAVGFERTETIEAADVILLNTCSVREKAEQKAFSFLGRLAELKGKKPELIIGVGGCVAQQEGEKILRRVSHVDLVFGTRTIHRLPEMVQKIAEKKCRIVDLEMAETCMEQAPEKRGVLDARPSRFVTIMRGCDNYCAYCVVPFVRGRETSREPEKILAEIKSLVAAGAGEITLLGQNVNSYGKKEGLCSFPELLAQVNEIKGLVRIRFTTSHPKDLSDELMDAFARLDKLCHHIHLPVQSGSNRILQIMNRRYTREMYLEKIRKLRAACRDIAVSSDFIVGFPGETRADFEDTLGLIKTVQYDSVFAFIYSDRPHAPAVHFKGKLPEEERKERLQELLALQSRITDEKNRAMVGSIVSVLVEGPSKQHGGVEGWGISSTPQWSGRTTGNKIVNFSVEDKAACFDLTGTLVDVRVERAMAHSLWGRPCGSDLSLSPKKGVNSYAA